MSLKENVSIWNEGIIQFDAGKYLECLHTFHKIADFSAKIVFNIGSVSMVLKDYDKSSKFFSDAVLKDPFLAVAYFQRGCVNVKLHRYKYAEQDFEYTLGKMRGNLLIDYRQLGLPVKLYASQVLMNLAFVCQKLSDIHKMAKLVHDASQLSLPKDSHQEQAVFSAFADLPNPNLCLLELPVKDSVFRPPKSVVDNLQKKDYLGKSQVVSSVTRTDYFVGFSTARTYHSNPTSPIASRKNNKLNVDLVEVTRGSLTPPPPSRPPPRPPPVLEQTTVKLFKKQFPQLVESSPPCYRRQRSRSSERSRPPPPSHAPPVCRSSENLSTKVLPPRPPLPVLQKR